MQTGYANFKYSIAYSCGDFYKEIVIPKSKQKVAKVFLANDLGVVENKNTNTKLKESFKLYEITLPIERGTVIGELCLIDENDEIVAKANLVLRDNIEKAGYFDNIDIIINKW